MVVGDCEPIESTMWRHVATPPPTSGCSLCPSLLPSRPSPTPILPLSPPAVSRSAPWVATASRPPAPRHPSPRLGALAAPSKPRPSLGRPRHPSTAHLSPPSPPSVLVDSSAPGGLAICGHAAPSSPGHPVATATAVTAATVAAPSGAGGALGALALAVAVPLSGEGGRRVSVVGVAADRRSFGQHFPLSSPPPSPPPPMTRPTPPICLC